MGNKNSKLLKNSLPSNSFVNPTSNKSKRLFVITSIIIVLVLLLGAFGQILLTKKTPPAPGFSQHFPTPTLKYTDQNQTNNYVPGEILVQFKTNNPDDIAALFKRYNLNYTFTIGINNPSPALAKVEVPVGEESNWIAIFRKEPIVLTANYNHINTIQTVNSNTNTVSCTNINRNPPELTFEMSYCDGDYCSNAKTKTDCESTDVVKIQNNEIVSGKDGKTDCAWSSTSHTCHPNL